LGFKGVVLNVTRFAFRIVFDRDKAFEIITEKAIPFDS
jgi:hypothetical protein